MSLTVIEIATKILGPHTIVHPYRKTQPHSNMGPDSDRSIHGKTLHRILYLLELFYKKSPMRGKQ